MLRVVQVVVSYCCQIIARIMLYLDIFGIRGCMDIISFAKISTCQIHILVANLKLKS